MGNKGVGLRPLLVGCGVHHWAPPPSHAVPSRGHRPGRGHVVRPIAWRSPGGQRCWRRQARRGQGGAQRWGVLGLRFRLPGQGCCGLRRRGCPACAPADGRWRSEPPDPWASCGKTHLTGMPPPPAAGGGQQRGAPTILHGPLRLTGTSCRSRHVGGRPAHIVTLRRPKRLLGFQRRVVQGAFGDSSCPTGLFL